MVSASFAVVAFSAFPLAFARYQMHVTNGTAPSAVQPAGMGMGEAGPPSAVQQPAAMGMGEAGSPAATQAAGMGMGEAGSAASASADMGMGMGAGSPSGTQAAGMGMGEASSPSATQAAGMGMGEAGSAASASADMGMGMGAGSPSGTQAAGMGMGEAGSPSATQAAGMGMGEAGSAASASASDSAGMGMGMGEAGSAASASADMGMGMGAASASAMDPTGTGTACASSATQTVAVGMNGLTFTPSTIFANVGDDVVFQFYPKKHAVVQSDFSNPCHPSSDGKGIHSGFIPSAKGMANKTFTVKVQDTKAIWLYCPQNNPKSHCSAGMVAVINPPANSPNTLAAFQLKAKAVAGNSTAPSGISGGMVMAAGASLPPCSSGTSSSGGSSSGLPSIASGAPAPNNTTPLESPGTGSSLAVNGVLGLLALFAGLML